MDLRDEVKAMVGRHGHVWLLLVHCAVVSHLTACSTTPQLPLMGMTVEEVHSILHLEDCPVTFSGVCIHGVYRDERGRRYDVYFAGVTPRVAAWSPQEATPFKPRDPRPQPRRKSMHAGTCTRIGPSVCSRC
jgi:hypothetical protein